jgi:hypothetical protein
MIFSMEYRAEGLRNIAEKERNLRQPERENFSPRPLGHVTL